jgi:hypothetical protein
MSRVVTLLLFVIFEAVSAYAAVTVTIDAASIAVPNPNAALIRINLQNCDAGRVKGTGQIVPRSQTVHPVGGTSTVTLYDNTQIDCGHGNLDSYYTFDLVYKGTSRSIGSYKLPTGTYQLAQLTPCSGAGCGGPSPLAPLTTSVTQIIAGSNITISPTSGIGAVTVNAIPSGVTNDVQFNQAGSFNVDSGYFTYTPTTHTLATRNITPPAIDGVSGYTSNAARYGNTLDYIDTTLNDSRTPENINTTIQTAYSKYPNINPLQINLQYFSGGNNTEYYDPGLSPGQSNGIGAGPGGGNWTILALNGTLLTPGQGGGILGTNVNCLAVGDCVNNEVGNFFRGISRGEDEGGELDRIFSSPTNDIAGGQISAVAVDAQNNLDIQTVPSGGQSFNHYEYEIVMDKTTGTWHSPGNIASFTSSPTGNITGSYNRATGDGSAGVDGHFGLSHMTQLISAIDSFEYAGTCGSTWAPVPSTVVQPTYSSSTTYSKGSTVSYSGSQYVSLVNSNLDNTPSSSPTQWGILYVTMPVTGVTTIASADGFLTDKTGLGVNGRNSNYNGPGGSMTGYCMNFDTTAGGTTTLTAGTIVFISGNNQGYFDYSPEFAQIIAVPNSTHATAFVHHPHAQGANISWGGAVGYCLGADTDIVAAGYNSQPENPQNAEERQCWPILQNTTGNVMDVYSAVISRVPSSNTPRVPLAISGYTLNGSGALTGVTANTAGDGSGNDYTTTVAVGAGIRTLPPPVVTITGCTTAPTLYFTQVMTTGTRTYIPNVLTGGNCLGQTPVFNVASTQPVTFGLYPVTMVYRALDPSIPSCPKDNPNCSVDGRPILMPALPGTFKVNDQISAAQWEFGRNAPQSQRSSTAPKLSQTIQTNGDSFRDYFAGLDGAAAYQISNQQDTSSYWGTWNPSVNAFVLSDTLDAIVSPPAVHEISGQWGGGNYWNAPPLQNKNGALGGYINFIGCGYPNWDSSGYPPVDLPCKHNLFYKYYLHQDSEGGSSVPSDIYVDPNTGNSGYEGNGTWTATAMQTYSLQIMNSGAGAGSYLGAAFSTSGYFGPGYIGLGIGKTINGTAGDASGQLGLDTVYTPNVVAGIEQPNPQGLFLAGGAAGTNSVNYGCTTVDSEGGETAGIIQNATNVPTVLGGTQSAPAPGIFVKCYIGQGGVAVNLYRLTAFGTYTTGKLNPTPIHFGIGAISQGYWDVGQAAGSAMPTSNNSGHISFGGVNSSTVNGPLCQWNSTTSTATNCPANTSIANITVAANTGPYAAGCGSARSSAMTGVTTASTFTFTPATDISSVTGWSTMNLYFLSWPTANTLNYRICNNTASSITPSASVTFNVSAK